MSNKPAAQSTSRRPFSLRELFCLTTLAGVSLALVLNSTWTNHERWLLGLTLGGTLLGIVLARACQQRASLIGILGGMIGGLGALVIIGYEWLATLNERATSGRWTASDLAEQRNDYLWAAAITAGLAVLLALLGVISFQFLVWSTDASQQGLVSATRRHPYRACAIVMVLAGLTACVANLDFLLAPQAWAPRHFIPLAHLERPLVYSHGVMTVRGGSLSHRGDWLIVEKYVSGINHPIFENELYRLGPRPHVVPFSEHPTRASFITFNCTGNRILFLEWAGDSYDDRSMQTPRLRIVDLDRQTSETLTEQPRSNEIHSLQWLPDGAIVINYGDIVYGRQGYTKLVPRQEPGHWSRHESEVATAFNSRSRLALEFPAEGMRLVDRESSREVASFSKPWVEKMTERMGGDPSSFFELSPDARFIMAGGRIYDRQSQTFRHWRVDEGFSQPYLHGFTPRGHAIYDVELNFVAWHPYYFLADAPFGQRLLSWLVREPIRLIDPATGSVVARTRPLDHEATSITLSHDGSRMAVFTDEGVYVYDVPVKFR